MITTSNDPQPEQPTPNEVDVEEMPVREDDTFIDVPVPKRVTREVDSGGLSNSDKEDTQQGDEGIDDPQEITA
ncbi:hypothetical protein EI77_01808 [Prosthecobacter fusiformis]|uniref:Uncharacterized protein n=1 Tax=Prosthecobacter fusiformis TaxID=48464 RepID=A0A4R7S6Y8_9BACT|nr:hypothetical protein [Prosthecobacter fusiformis]TDU73338.1 hypothetical protein EI77_01808 [Prosthecobacter fusiformis]